MRGDGRGRGQLFFHRAQPVTAPSTLASVTYDDPNGSWESWEPGASWNGANATGGGHGEGPSANPQPGHSNQANQATNPPPRAQPAQSEADLRWDDDGDTSLRHPNKQLPGTLITMSELDWEDTEELATELWRHPMRPRISRDPQARAHVQQAQRLPARSPVRPDPRQLPMPLPGPGGARPHARSEEPTARLRVPGPNGALRAATVSTAHGGLNGPPQRLPAPPPARQELNDSLEPEPRARKTTAIQAIQQPRAHALDFEVDEHSSSAMPEDWLDESPAAYAAPLPATGRFPVQPSAARSFLQPPAAHTSPRPTSAIVPPPPAGYAQDWPPPRASAGHAPEWPPSAAAQARPGSFNQTHSAGFGAPSQLPPAPPARASLPDESFGSAHAPAQLPSAPRARQGLYAEPYDAASFGVAAAPAQLPPAPAPRPSLPVESYESASFRGFAPSGQLPPAPAPRPSLSIDPYESAASFGGFAPAGQLPPAPAPRPSLPVDPYESASFGGFGSSGQLPPAPAPRQSLPVDPYESAAFGAPAPSAQLPPAPAPRPSLPVDPHEAASFGAGGLSPSAQRPSPQPEPLTRTQSFGQPSAARLDSPRERAMTPQLPAPPRPSLPIEPLERTQTFGLQPTAAVPAAPIESLRQRTMTPQRLLPTPPPPPLPAPPRFHSSAHIPTIIGTPTAASAPTPASRRTESSLAQSGARLSPRAAGRDRILSPPPQFQAQSQLIEQLQEQLLEAMARARVQEARAAEAEKSVEQVEEQLAAVARGQADESEQLQAQLLQLSEQLRVTEARVAEADRRPRRMGTETENTLHLSEAELIPRSHKQGRANLILSGLLASSLSFGGAAYFMFYAPLQKQLGALEQLRTQDSQAHAQALSNLQGRSNAERQGLEAQNADLRKQLDAARAQATAAASPVEEPRHGRGRRGGAETESPDGTPAGTRSARAIERRMRRSHAAPATDGADDSEAKPRKARTHRGDDNGNDPLGGI